MRFNSQGVPLSGRGWRWIDDSRQIRQLCDAQGCRLADQHGLTIDARDATIIAAGGGKWAGCLQSQPRYHAFSNFGFESPGDFYVEDIAIDGSAVVLVPVARNRVGLWNDPAWVDGDVLDARACRGGFVACFANGRVWSSRHGWVSVPPGVMPFNAHHVGGDVLLIATHRYLYVQEANRPWGMVIAEATAQLGTFYPDGYQRPDGSFVVGWTQTQGDTGLQQAVVDRSAFLDLGSLSDTVAAPPPAQPAPQPTSVRYTRISPDYTALVREIADRFPLEWDAARKRPDGTRDDRFIRRFSWEAAKVDRRIGLNGKRGGDLISTDAVSFLNETGPGGVEVIDIITGDHRPAWQDRTLPEGNPETGHAVPGKYIAPSDPGGGASPPEPDPTAAEPASLKTEIAALRRENVTLREMLTRHAARLDELERALSQRGPLPPRVALRSAHGLYVAAESDGAVVANRTDRGAWEVFEIEAVD